MLEALYRDAAKASYVLETGSNVVAAASGDWARCRLYAPVWREQDHLLPASFRHSAAPLPPAATLLDFSPGACDHHCMAEPKRCHANDLTGTKIYADMPNYVCTEAEFLSAVEIGIADLDAGRTISFEEVAAEFRRNYGKA